MRDALNRVFLGMSTARTHLLAFKEGIRRARLIREDLAKALTEYDLKKVRGLNKAYIETLKQTITQGELYLERSTNLNTSLRVAQAIDNYKAFLSTLD